MSADTKPRTRRNERGTYATGGAVNQDGDLPIYDCTTCGNEVVWATSNRTGRRYLVNVSRGEQGRRFYMKHNVHDCARIMADREAARDAADDASTVAEDIAHVRRLRYIYTAFITEDGAGNPHPFDTSKLTSFIHYIDTDPTVQAMRDRMGI